ncbi:MAG: hypothetical protein D6705_11245 [Deltaproteobacteria bacterium]|nr:MAG: hypothetical protein D6705_11245 [Deltaproteobacteria bacterium]
MEVSASGPWVPDDDPRHLVPRPWGGRRLGTVAGEPVGEAWVLSPLPDRPSYVGGRQLSSLVDGPLGLLVKILDTAAPLSVQVHPDDGDLGPDRLGKEEAWIVLDADEGAWIRAGLREGVDAASFVEAARRADADRAEAVLGLLEAFRPRPGDMVLLPAGVPHALGPGLLLVEVQQPTDATLRLYDYGRGRPLHLADAARVLRPDRRPQHLPAGTIGRLEGAHLELRRDVVVEAPDTPTVWLATSPGATWDAPDGRRHALPVGTPVLTGGGGTGRAGAAPLVAAWAR